MNKDTLSMISRLERLGISSDDAWSLRRISMTLHRWHERECGTGNGGIERINGKPYWFNANSPRAHYRIPDLETGALKRLNAIMTHYPDLSAYVQTDPRGASLYIYPAASLAAGQDIDCHYNRVGVAVFK